MNRKSPAQLSGTEPNQFYKEQLSPGKILFPAADCGSSTATDGKANIWTDAKIIAVNGVPLVDDFETVDVNEGPVSLKGELPIIVYSGCPIKTK